MPKHNPSSSERSKVRIFFVEGDFAPGDLQNLTQALTTAIRPTPLLLRGGPAVRLGAGDGSPNGAAESEMELTDAEVTIEPESELSTPIVKAPTRVRTYRKPTPVELDMKAGGKPFEEFAREKGPVAHRAKYLVAAAWLHDYAKVETITADHVFTCYKAAGWTFDVQDPTATFRQLKSEGIGSLNRGSFGINHLGLAEVEKMKPL
jgi:hypothetical protein